MSRLPLDLPEDREKALDAIAKGWTRKPTTAHPDCLCGGRALFNLVRYAPDWNGEMRAYRGSLHPITVPCPVHRRNTRGDSE